MTKAAPGGGVRGEEPDEHFTSDDATAAPESPTDRPFFDPYRSAFLWDVGLPHFAAAVTVDADGHDKLWVLSAAAMDEDLPDVGDPDQPHEKLGRLPAAIRDRIWGVFRCGRPTRSGQPCRIRVAESGGACGSHRDKAPAETLW